MYSLEGYKEESKHLVFCLPFVSGTKPRVLPGKQCITEDLNRCKYMMHPIVLILAIKAAGCWMVSAEEINWGSNSQRTWILTSRACRWTVDQGRPWPGRWRHSKRKERDAEATIQGRCNVRVETELDLNVNEAQDAKSSQATPELGRGKETFNPASKGHAALLALLFGILPLWTVRQRLFHFFFLFKR